ncbi:DUF2837 family protein [Arcicella aquatica]|uniref:Lipid II flippase Amj n=1 Tax=Arcicella aquatica TaxID=217141 RepID=A0ABU5QKX3_9BACT|nr:DUF2837 family protein [Arcicella aquatica]MEA5257585.1 DUF2837 family protein [Arcicella aquatica]
MNVIIILIVLNLIINLIATLSFAARIAGIRTGKIALAFSLFNILNVISRTANGFQAPLLANYVEKTIHSDLGSTTFTFRLILLSYTFATLLGIFLTPTTQRIFFRAIMEFYKVKTFSKMFVSFVSKGSLFKKTLLYFTSPSYSNIKLLFKQDNYPWKIFILNTVATAILSVGVIASVYAGYLNPDYRSTASNLSALINGFSTIIMFVFIDPYLSILTDQYMGKEINETTFRFNIIFVMLSRLLGTVLAQFLLLPAAHLIAYISHQM